MIIIQENDFNGKFLFLIRAEKQKTHFTDFGQRKKNTNIEFLQEKLINAVSSVCDLLYNEY